VHPDCGSHHRRRKVVVFVKFITPAQTAPAFLLAFLGVSSTICLSIFSTRSNRFKFIQQWGIFSLAIFVAHTIASAMARIILQKLLGITEPWIHLLIGTGVGIYLSIALVLLGERLKFPYFFTYGKSFKV
jgi:hypothetical protein